MGKVQWGSTLDKAVVSQVLEHDSYLVETNDGRVL